MLDLMLIGNRIKELRKKSGLTQKQLADKLFISFQAVSNWERGITPPELESLLKMSDLFGVLIDDLFKPEKESAFLGIDGGGTKTEFVAVSESGHVLRRAVRDGCNPNDIGYNIAADVILDGISDVLRDIPSVKSVFCGIAGISASDYASRLYSDITGRYTSLKAEVKNDAFNLFAMEPKAEMSVISGTGSVVFIKKNDDFIRLGGWGHLIDSAGSAYDIGRDAIRVALGEEDFRETFSLIRQKLCEKLNTQSVWEAIGSIYKGGKPCVASLASVVFEAHGEGDEKAGTIIDSSAKALAELLNAGISIHGASPIAVASGGVFEHYSDVMLPMIKKYTDTELIITGLPPVYGACRRACEIAGHTITDGFYGNFKKSYAGEQK